LPSLTFAAAWAAYRRSEARLPAKPAPVQPQRIDSVAAIADDFDLVVLDAWGVLNIGETPIASARAAVAGLRAAGKRLLILSNDGTRRGEEAAARHRRRGFDVAVDEIVAGIDLLPDLLRELAPSGPVGLIADAPAPFPELTAGMMALGDDAGDYDRVAAIIFLSASPWNERRQALLEASLAARPRPLIIGNPDIVSPDQDGMAVEPGYYAHALAAAIPCLPIFCGKPFAPIYARIAARFPHIAPERVLCVGDTLHTDILGARAAGYRSLLVEDGFCRGRDGLDLAAESGIWPDFVAPHL
jgi:HAD superfamily hydrolase (TIGR01450 family)